MNQSTDIGDFAPSSLSSLDRSAKGDRSGGSRLLMRPAGSSQVRPRTHGWPPRFGKSPWPTSSPKRWRRASMNVRSVAQQPRGIQFLLLGAKDRDIIFIDEIHEMKREYQTALYLALDKQRISSRQGTAHRKASLSATSPAAGDDGRIQHSPTSSGPDEAAIAIRILFRRRTGPGTSPSPQGIGWTVDEEVFPQIAQRSRGTSRLALRLLQSCHRVARSIGESNIVPEHLNRACELEQIDELGLGPNEQQYMSILARGPARLKYWQACSAFRPEPSAKSSNNS